MSALSSFSLFPAGLKGTRGFSFPCFCWLCAVLEWEAEDFSEESAGTPQGEARFSVSFYPPPPSPHTPSRTCLFVCVISCKWVSSFCPDWCRADDNFCQHQIAAWLLIGDFSDHTNPIRHRSLKHIFLVRNSDCMIYYICTGEEGSVPAGRQWCYGRQTVRTESSSCLTWHELVLHPDLQGSLCSFYLQSHTFDTEKKMKKGHKKDIYVFYHDLFRWWTFLRGHPAPSIQKWSSCALSTVYCIYSHGWMHRETCLHRARPGQTEANLHVKFINNCHSPFNLVKDHICICLYKISI